MKNVKDDAKEVNGILKTLLLQQISNCKVEYPIEVEKACKAYIILALKLCPESTERYLTTIEYYGQMGIASKAVIVDYYTDTEARVSTPLKAATTLIDEFVENKTFGGEERFLSSIFKGAPEYLRVAAHTYLVQYAYHKTNSMSAVSFLMNKFKILED